MTTRANVQAPPALMAGDRRGARSLQSDAIACVRTSGGLFQLPADPGLMVVIESRLGQSAEARAHLDEMSPQEVFLSDGLAAELA